jgi:hypothetical protein
MARMDAYSDVICNAMIGFPRGLTIHRGDDPPTDKSTCHQKFL